MDYDHLLESIVESIEKKWGDVKVVKKSIDIGNKEYIECSVTYRMERRL